MGSKRLSAVNRAKRSVGYCGSKQPFAEIWKNDLFADIAAVRFYLTSDCFRSNHQYQNGEIEEFDTYMKTIRFPAAGTLNMNRNQ